MTKANIQDVSIKTGRYRHYKGKDYEVYGVATHSESGELLVVYRPLYGNRLMSVRPLVMFTEMVVVEGVEQPRFAFVKAAEVSSQFKGELGLSE